MSASVLGFYLWGHTNVESADYILGRMREHYPDSHLVISSDAGEDFSEVAHKHGAVKYIHGEESHGYPESPDRYGWTAAQAKLWLDRVYQACSVISNDYVMLMEEDVLVKERFRFQAADVVMIPNIKNPIAPCAMEWVQSRGGATHYPYYSAGGGSIINRDKYMRAYENHLPSFIENYERLFVQSFAEGVQGWGWNDSILCVIMYAENATFSTELPISESGNEDDPAPIIHKFKKYYRKNLSIVSGEKRKKIVFYHTYLDGNYKLIVQEQLTKIFTSGLYDACDSIEFHIASPDESRISWALDLVKKFTKIKPTVVRIDRSQYPADYRESKITLLNLQKMAEEVDGCYCYIHSKGVSNQGYLIDMWRNSSDYATIYRWKENIEMLDNGYDAVGPNLRYETFLGYYPHFSGTYFWATSKHIKTLDHSYLENLDNKYLEEFWIGSNHSAKLGSTFECGHNEPYLVESSINQYIKA